VFNPSINAFSPPPKIACETKGMTSAEISAYFRKTGEAAAKKYGFTRIAGIRDYKPEMSATRQET
jgi:hypothetical protein